MIPNTQYSGALGRYPILGQVGESTNTLLLLSEHPTLGCPITLKTSRFKAPLRPEVEKNLLREAHFLGAFTHPNALKIYDSAKTDTGQCFLVLGAIPERTLNEYLLRYSPLPTNNIISIGRQLIDLLSAVHDAGIILRALSPGQIGISREPFLLKLIEMSHAVSLDEVPEPLPAALRFKPFVAPELRIEGITSQGADLYSLGIILFEMISGERRANGSPSPSPKEAQRTLQKRRDLPAGLCDVVVELLDPRSSARPELWEVRRLLQWLSFSNV